MFARTTSSLLGEAPWGKPVDGSSFNEKYETEFRPSGIPGGGNGWWAKVDIPKGTRMRRCSVKDGSLLKVGSLEELEKSGWSMDDSVNYGIGHRKDPSAIYFLNPGTACNHADPSRDISIIYTHDEQDVFELYTNKDVKAGDEMFIHYGHAFGPCEWFDTWHKAPPMSRSTLSQLGTEIDHMVLKVKPAADNALEMKVSLKKPKGFYVNAALSFLKGLEAKPATDDKEAMEAKPPVDNLRISGTGEACNVAVAAATNVVTDGAGTITGIQTTYMRISGVQCAQIIIDIKKN